MGNNLGGKLLNKEVQDLRIHGFQIEKERQ